MLKILKLHIYHLKSIGSKMKVKTIYSTNGIGKLNALELCHGNTNAFLAYFLKDFQSVKWINEHKLKPHLHILFHLKRLR